MRLLEMTKYGTGLVKEKKGAVLTQVKRNFPVLIEQINKKTGEKTIIDTLKGLREAGASIPYGLTEDTFNKAQKSVLEQNKKNAKALASFKQKVADSIKGLREPFKNWFQK